MKVLDKVVVLVAVILTWGSASRAECPGQFVAKLQEGHVPANSDLQLGECKGAIEPVLAEAVAVYLTRNPAPKVSDALQVIQVVKEVHRAENWQRNFGVFAKDLKNRLQGTELAFDLATSQDKFALLDPLTEKLKGLVRTEEPVEPSGVATPAEKQIDFLMGRINEQVKVDQDLRRFQNVLGMTLLGLALVNLVVLGYLAIPKFLRQKGRAVPSLAEAARLEALEQRISSGEERASELTRTVSQAKEEIAGEIARQLEQHDADWNSRLTAAMNQVTPPPAPNLDPLLQDIEELKASFQKAASNGEGDRTAALLPLEREVLKEAWARFMENKEIMTALASARDEKWKQTEDSLLLHLPRCVPQDLKPTLDAALAPVKDFNNLMTRIFLVPLLLGESNKSSAKPESKELLLLRELTSLLTMIQTSNLLADRLNFRLEPWITDCFLGFADLFLQRYQKAQMEKRENQLQPGYEIVRSILKVADLEPVDLTLGVTAFDSTQHIGRSTTSDPSVASGVILGVIRNGFVRGGQQVIRQPEVIVNRVA